MTFPAIKESKRAEVLTNFILKLDCDRLKLGRLKPQMHPIGHTESIIEGKPGTMQPEIFLIKNYPSLPDLGD